MLIVSFIRHGESLDNLRAVWAGHCDAELSELGVQQAKALGDAYANTRLDAIITSDLKRAHATAAALFDGQPDPKPSFDVDRDLREQSFGDAEGHPWQMQQSAEKSLEAHIQEGRYPVLFGRHAKFPNGESLDDLAVRAERVVRDRVLAPYLHRALSGDVHVALVSHGLCISEMIPALLKRNDGGAAVKDYRGLLNTAWSRAVVQVKPGTWDTLQAVPPLVVTVTDLNRHEHITDIKRQGEIIEHDPEQQAIRDFFAGGDGKKLQNSQSNLSDDVVMGERN